MRTAALEHFVLPTTKFVNESREKKGELSHDSPVRQIV